jgi:hypothetical protein
VNRIVLLCLVFFFAPKAFASDTDSHTVTVNVSSITELSIQGGNVTLTINSGTAESGPESASDSSTELFWSTNEVDKKITVETNLAAPNFTLSVQADNIAGSGTAIGTSAGQVFVSTTPQDFVTAISEAEAHAALAYFAEADASDGTGSDVHTITYTIVDI